MNLNVQDVNAGYDSRNVLKSVSLSIAAGEFLAVIGANGSGKSTLLKTMSRTLKPQSGCVYLDGASIFAMNTKLLATKLAVLPQIRKSPEDFTVRDLVSFGRFPHLGPAGRLKHEDFEAVDSAIEQTKTGDLQHRLLSTLSGGERQRAWIAMALAQTPKVLLLDEPTTFLDISHQFETLELIHKLNEKTGLAIVMAIHDLNQASQYAKRIAALKNGRVLKDGPPSQIITEETLKDIFNMSVRIVEDPECGRPYIIPRRARRE